MMYNVGHRLGKIPTKVDGKHLPQYSIWKRLLERCYSGNVEKYPKYVDVVVSEEWLCYEKFYEDVSEMIGFAMQGYHIDKDILGNGKLYSKDTCCFVPMEVNMFFTNKKSNQGIYSTGVDFHKKTGKFRARCSIGGKVKHLGLFSSNQDAFFAYSNAKELYAKYLASKWKGCIDGNVYNALMNYECEAC